MAAPWQSSTPPKRILAIRLQALGDLVITLPYLQYLRRTLPPGTVIDLLTREEVAAIPRSLDLFDHVYAIGGERNFKKQFLYTLALLPKLLLRRYDMVLDLQNNPLSIMARKAIRPQAWCAFDKYSPIPAGTRNRQTIETAGLTGITADHEFYFKTSTGIADILVRNGWDESKQLVALNPAGAFSSRNWPDAYYIAFAQLWLEQFPDTQFVIAGVDRVAEKAATLKAALGVHLVDITNQTDAAQAFELMQYLSFMLSEDSGMMHMAWVSGVPTLALFGSTRSDWAQPLGAHTAFLDSSDLPCGNCMQEICRFGDTHCLSRYSPDLILERATALWKHTRLQAK